MPTGRQAHAEHVPPRVVFDTNVLISGIISPGNARTLIEAAVEGKLVLIISHGLVREFAGVISRGKFGLTEGEQVRLVRFLRGLGEMVRVRSRFRAVKDDPDDDIVLRTAFDGKADCIVSGDRHILSLSSFRGIAIFSVAGMLEALEKSTRPTK